MSISPKEKFRPYLSLEDITLLRDLLSSSNPSPQSAYLLKTFNLIILKASSGLASPSYISTPRISRYSAAGLGLEQEPDLDDETINKLLAGSSES